MSKIKRLTNCQCLTKPLDWPLWKNLNLLALLTFCLESGFIKLLFLKSRKPFFLSRLWWNTSFYPVMPKIKTWKNCQFLTKPLDWPLFGFINFLSWKRFFLCRIWYNTFACRILPKIKRWKNCHFLTETMD